MRRSGAMTTVLVAIVAALASWPTFIGWLLTRRSGNVREIRSDAPRRTGRPDTATWAFPAPDRLSCISAHRGADPAIGCAGWSTRSARSGRRRTRGNRPGRQPGGRAPLLGAVFADHVDLRRRWTTALPGHRRPQNHRPAFRPATAVGLITMSLGKLSDVSARIEPLLTSRRTVELCRVAGCCCCCSC